MDKTQFTAPLPVSAVTVTDPFWGRMMELVRTKVIPYQWDALNDRVEGASPSHCMENFRVAAGLQEGEFQGCVFQDSDFAKWIEAVGYALTVHPDKELEKIADEAIDLVVAAQQPDGYLDTYYIINGLDKRWTNLCSHHELYCMGHLLEGAIAYYDATGKRKLLDAMIRYVDYVDSVFGREEGKTHGYPGHEVIEMALVKLYNITGDPRHLALAKYFIDERGQSPLYFEEESQRLGKKNNWSDSHFGFQYYQAGKPVRDQKVAEGHAVRAMYLYAGMADVARLTGDDGLAETCQTLWNNVTNRQMYITGAVGASPFGEAFTYDYDLPNDTVYGETCAAIGLVFFARRMLELKPSAQVADVMERALFNGVISGMSLDGTKFFYVNPLEVNPEASGKDKQHAHVKVERQKWFGCACCPPNVARLMMSVGNYAYTVREDAVYTHLFLGGGFQASLSGKPVAFAVETGYPWKGDVAVRVKTESPVDFAYAIRIPGWCGGRYRLTVNGAEAACRMEDGYAVIRRTWTDGDVVNLQLDLTPQVIAANPRVREDIGKVAVTRGPVVYCLEQEDNGPDLHRVLLADDPDFQEKMEPELLGGVVTLQSRGKVLDQSGWDADTLYRPAQALQCRDVSLKWIPYYAWANRGVGEMTVWVRR